MGANDQDQQQAKKKTGPAAFFKKLGKKLRGKKKKNKNTQALATAKSPAAAQVIAAQNNAQAKSITGPAATPALTANLYNDNAKTATANVYNDNAKTAAAAPHLYNDNAKTATANVYNDNAKSVAPAPHLYNDNAKSVAPNVYHDGGPGGLFEDKEHVYNDGAKKPSVDNDDADEEEGEELDEAANVHDPFNLGQGHLITTPLLDQFRGEQHGTQTGVLPSHLGGATGIDTHATAYAASADQHRASVENGQLIRAGGQVADSSNADAMYSKDKDERHNFVMDGHGSTYISDSRAEFLANMHAAKAAGETSSTRINHSTMLAGGDVAGAGTMRTRDGKVETIGDGSGHYQPTVTQTAQVARTMAQQGILDPARSTVELTPKTADQKELNVSSQELLSYGEGKNDRLGAATASFQQSGNKQDLAAPEAEIRARHDAKDVMLAELLAKTKKQDA